jgi:hypothetical protein
MAAAFWRDVWTTSTHLGDDGVTSLSLDEVGHSTRRSDFEGVGACA